MRLYIKGFINFQIFKERAGVISPKPIWVCFESCWMYEDYSLLKLIWIIITEWRNDRHLVG